MGSRLDELCTLLNQAPGSVIIQTHDVPDPDAIAAAFGLQALLRLRGIDSRLVYNSAIEKTDTRTMLQLFDIDILPVTESPHLKSTDWVLLVDAQKGSGNILDLPGLEVAVIDHHSLRAGTAWRFSDIRPEIGACSTIIASYYFENSLTPSPAVATALLYGLFIDTDYLVRGVADLDAEMFCRLNHLADRQQLRTLRSCQLSRRDLALYAEGLRSVEIYDSLGFLELGPANDSLIGAATDLLLSVDEVEVAVTYSTRATDVKFSVRSSRPDVLANDLAKAIADGIGHGGGHGHMAGGTLPLDSLPRGKPPALLIRYRCIAFMERLERLA
ncbi:MAG: hypothetical protein A2087_03540 [Spirochaetes bacterium GWD1_61_31]|nr:MAG: hypothetical protein A2Y37_11300 [Spirochaetes bacterium GWB1_60_80]OHD32452.1 MAG: hypothetical protein A2004_09345 [Spirochaetes bacterium GWC1_61_12]OHD36131.1 MAG: hypothetical protein A2087_03540 [Spirochaetes bacterium GWD1_61_31]OHD45017.1 MAG: hypothetical protein A2Y35_13345 [Spirochaetes bacterium GWE1_60_18]OHD60128.1 MAG: hypothetical protein A2Y32_11460 [Spirochaetes bacterium GWF1_60_12]HAP43699.1 DHH family phosphoesterase [Spirochaetaceae bacterium]